MKLTIKNGHAISGKYADGVEFIGTEKPADFDTVYPVILADVTETVNAMPGQLSAMAWTRFLCRADAIKRGKLMTSKYDGIDAATGTEFKAGTKIYYYNRETYIA